jgi:hypothetical protein
VGDSFLIRVLAALPAEDLEPIGHELAILTNQIVIAEACDLSELSEVRRCAESVHDYVNIGVAHLAKGSEQEAAQLLHEVTLRPFFQVGVSLTFALQQRAQQLETTLQQYGFQEWETFLDSPFRETYIGARRQRPLFFRGLETPGEILFHRFHDLAEVKRVETVLAQIPVWFTALRRWQLLPQGRAPQGVTLGVLWNTAFARWVMEDKVGLQPLSRDELSALQKQLHKTPVEEKSAQFLTLAVTQLKLTHTETEALRALAAHAREKLDEALAVVEAGSPDLRFIEGLLMTE